MSLEESELGDMDQPTINSSIILKDIKSISFDENTPLMLEIMEGYDPHLVLVPVTSLEVRRTEEGLVIVIKAD